MKRFLAMIWIGLALSVTQAQETNEVEWLKRQLQQMQENFDRVQREQREQIEALSRKLDAVTKQQLAETEKKKLEEQLAAELQSPVPANDSTAKATPSRAWSPTDPLRIGNARAYMDMGMVATFAAGGSTANDIEGGTQLGGHDPNQRGFTVQGVELNLQGAVDPYFRGNANILFATDSGGESFLELEEAWLETVSLPAHLQIRAGQFLSEFGRQNTQHPHSWSFVDAPLVSARFLGPDGLRNPGARVSWLMPLPFYSELFLGIQNSHGETAAGFRSAGHSHGGEVEESLPFGFRHPDNDRGVKGLGDLLFTPRYVTAFDLSDSQTLMLGASAALGPNASGGAGDTGTQIYGVDLYWKWKPANAHGGFPFVSWQTEAMLRRYDLGMFDWDENGNGLTDDGEVVDIGTGLPAVLNKETVTDWGFYSQWLYGFRKGWVAGVRFDYVAGETADYEKLGLSLDGEALGRDSLRNQRWRFSPNLTWYPTEFSKIRLQYNYDDRRDVGVDHSVWLQFEFLLGAHAAHKF
ncbi:MAG: hypothetical protein H7Y43_03600 [Akkermansiaceae bacterium]|nr:hypothetical protein [Verrucomicrobiales bacterium]